MTIAVSVPDEVFEEVERLAPASAAVSERVYGAALREYVARHVPDEAIEAMDRVCAAVNDEPDDFVTEASTRSGILTPSPCRS